MIRRDDLKVGMRVLGTNNYDKRYHGIVTSINGAKKEATLALYWSEFDNSFSFDSPLTGWCVFYRNNKDMWASDIDYGELFILNDKMQKLKERLMPQ